MLKKELSYKEYFQQIEPIYITRRFNDNRTNITLMEDAEKMEILFHKQRRYIDKNIHGPCLISIVKSTTEMLAKMEKHHLSNGGTGYPD